LQWIHKKRWAYSATFDAEVSAAGKDERVDLVFDGLDTFATVKLNGHEILRYVSLKDSKIDKAFLIYI
jgi:beta-mannosidase